MFSIRDTVKRDLATYYAGEPSNRVSRTPALLLVSVIAIIIAIFAGVPSKDFLAGVISTQAILAGFSFNVLFYLVANRLTNPSGWSSIEHELRFKRLKVLSDEIFDNICYFNLVAVLSIALGLILLFTESNNAPGWFENFSKTVITEEHFKSLKKFIGAAGDVFTRTTLACLIFTVFESFYAFIRLVSRVRFYFEMLKNMNDDNLSS